MLDAREEKLLTRAIRKILKKEVIATLLVTPREKKKPLLFNTVACGTTTPNRKAYVRTIRKEQMLVLCRTQR